MPTEIKVYGKPGCTLCEEAEEVLFDLSDRFELSVTRINILEDEGLFERYRYRVPVVLIGGIERLALKFQASEVEAALVAAEVKRRE